MNRNRLIAFVTALTVVLCSVAIVWSNHGTGGADSFIILHTNDAHCHYDDEGSMGYETLSALKKDLSKDNVVFTVDAGDNLQGAAYGLFSKGESSIDVMNLINYDLVIPGNHDFDFGAEIMKERMDQLNCPVICANLEYKNTGKTVFDEYLVIERGGFKVGFFGLLTTETPVTSMPGNMGNMTVTDPVEAAERMVSTLKAEKVDCTVAVGHLGVDLNDYALTSDQVCSRVSGIDIFIDGHSHTEMEDGKRCDGSRVLEPSDTVIASTGCYMKNIGIVTYTHDKITAKLYRGPFISDTYAHDAITKVHEKYDKEFSTVIGTTTIRLNGDRDDVRNKETNMGDFVTDVMLDYADTQIAIINGGGIRDSIEQGDITLLDVYNVFPFLNYVCVLEVKGSDVYAVMEFSLERLGESDGGFIQFSGMTVTYDPDAEKGHRVISIEIAGSDMDPDAMYSMATIDFVWRGGDNDTIFVDYDATSVGILNDIFIDHIKEIGTIDESTISGGRLVTV